MFSMYYGIEHSYHMDCFHVSRQSLFRIRKYVSSDQFVLRVRSSFTNKKRWILNQDQPGQFPSSAIRLGTGVYILISATQVTYVCAICECKRTLRVHDSHSRASAASSK